MPRYCLPPTISPALVPDKFSTQRVKDVPDAQVDGFGQAKRGNRTAHLSKISQIPRSQSRNNCRNQGFKCPRSVVAFLWVRGESSQLPERPCSVVGSAPTTAGSWVAWYGGLGIGIGGVDSDRWIDGLEPFECRCGSLLPTWEWSTCRR